MAWPQTRDGRRRETTAYYVEAYRKKVPCWLQLCAEYAEIDLKLVPYIQLQKLVEYASESFGAAGRRGL